MIIKTGRPTNSVKNGFLKCRIDLATANKLKACCNFYGLNKSDFIRSIIDKTFLNISNQKETQK